jgi:uncharacterized membrane protein
LGAFFLEHDQVARSHQEGEPMSMTNDSQQKIEAYLGRLRVRLRDISEPEVREIVEELRSHIVEKAATAGVVTVGGVDAALAALGSPEELASQFLTSNLMARAEVSRSPWQILKSLCRWASLSIAGFFVLLGTIIGYLVGLALMLVAAARLFHPHTAGLWSFPNSNGSVDVSFRLGFGGLPVGGRDLLGWWIVPVGWLAGGTLVMLTTQIAVWFVRQYRRSLRLPRS